MVTGLADQNEMLLVFDDGMDESRLLVVVLTSDAGDFDAVG